METVVFPLTVKRDQVEREETLVLRHEALREPLQFTLRRAMKDGMRLRLTNAKLIPAASGAERKFLKIRTIVITGGPCGGKTTAMSWLQNALTSAGYAVIFLTETFTELANAGVSSYNCKDNFAFQSVQVRYQLERERLYRRAAEALANDNVVIVHDRGSMDDKRKQAISQALVFC